MPRMNRIALFLAAALAAGAAAAAVPGLPTSGRLLDSYAAVVNNKVVTVGDVLAAMAGAHERLAEQYAGQELEDQLLKTYDRVRATLVESELVLLDFEAQGGSLPDRAVEDHVNSVIHDQFNNDRTAFLKALADQRLTYAEWHKQMKDQLVVQIMRQREVSSKILVTPLDLQTAYAARQADYALPERVRLRTLAFAGAAAEARPRAAAACEKIRAGEQAFAADADATLQDDGEFLDVATLQETLRAAVAALAPGDVSEPLEIGGAIYLVQLVERQPARVRPLDEVAPELEKKLRAAEFERLNQAWIDALRAKYHVQLFDHDLFE